MVQNRQKVKVNPFNFWPKEPANSGIYPMYFLKKYTSIEAQAKIKTVFKTYRSFLKGICYSKLVENRQKFARWILESGYSPGRIYSMYFHKKYTYNEAQTKMKTVFKG